MEEQAKASIATLTGFDGRFDRPCGEATQLEAFEATEESKSDLRAIEAKYKAAMRPLAGKRAHGIEA